MSGRGPMKIGSGRAEEHRMDGGNILTGLEHDHERTRELLTLMGAELARIESGDSDDVELVRDIMQYLTHYPELVHHPLEEELGRHIFEEAALVRIGPRLADEHAALARAGAEFLDIVARVVDGGLASRADIAAQGQRYVELYRAHLAWEEADVFSALVRLNAVTLQCVAKRVERSLDPLFGPVRQDEYAHLWRHIQQQR